ncbi:MAG: hypothetical protein FJ224_00435 [Lentisphaerae bacterium]|nr:hypothetical protein [Lentisphaerota bacterium]
MAKQSAAIREWFTPRRSLILTLSLLFGLACAWRVLHFPYNRETLFRGMPANAFWVAEHPSLSSAWKDVLSNPLVKAGIAAGGLEDESAGLLRSRRIAGVMESLAARNTVASYVPSDSEGAFAGPALVAASWVGYRTQFLRWRSLPKAMGPGAAKYRLMPGVDIWTVKSDVPGGSGFLSICVAEGVIYACLSRDPFGVQHVVLRALAGGKPARSAAVVAGKPEPERGVQQGWALWQWPFGPTRNMWNSSVYRLEVQPGGSLRGEAVSAPLSAFPVASAPAVAGDWDGLGAVLGNVPAAFAALTREQAGRLAGGTGSLTFAVMDMLIDGNDPVFIALAGGDCSGRILGLKVPMLLAGVKSDLAPDSLFARVSAGLDLLNRRYKLGLIPRRRGDGIRTWIALDSSGGKDTPGLLEGEAPAIALVGGWLIAASSEAGLKQLLAGPAPREPGKWLPVMKSAGSFPVFWCDSTRICGPARDAVAVMTLWTIAKETEASPGSLKRADLDRARAWFVEAERAGEIVLETFSSGDSAGVRLRVTGTGAAAAIQ